MTRRIQFIPKNNMASLKQKALLDLPDEVIEEIMTFLSFDDLYKLRKQGKRLASCTEKVLIKKPFSKNLKIIILFMIIWVFNMVLV